MWQKNYSLHSWVTRGCLALLPTGLVIFGIFLFILIILFPPNPFVAGILALIFTLFVLAYLLWTIKKEKGSKYPNQITIPGKPRNIKSSTGNYTYRKKASENSKRLNFRLLRKLSANRFFPRWLKELLTIPLLILGVLFCFILVVIFLTIQLMKILWTGISAFTSAFLDRPHYAFNEVVYIFLTVLFLFIATLICNLFAISTFTSWNILPSSGSVVADISTTIVSLIIVGGLLVVTGQMLIKAYPQTRSTTEQAWEKIVESRRLILLSIAWLVITLLVSFIFITVFTIFTPIIAILITLLVAITAVTSFLLIVVPGRTS